MNSYTDFLCSIELIDLRRSYYNERWRNFSTIKLWNNEKLNVNLSIFSLILIVLWSAYSSNLKESLTFDRYITIFASSILASSFTTSTIRRSLNDFAAFVTAFCVACSQPSGEEPTSSIILYTDSVIFVNSWIEVYQFWNGLLGDIYEDIEIFMICWNFNYMLYHANISKQESEWIKIEGNQKYKHEIFLLWSRLSFVRTKFDDALNILNVMEEFYQEIDMIHFVRLIDIEREFIDHNIMDMNTLDEAKSASLIFENDRIQSYIEQVSFDLLKFQVTINWIYDLNMN